MPGSDPPASRHPLNPHPAGAPATNRTYFCDASNGNCFIVISTLGNSNYSVAKAYCEGIQGGLVSYSGREKQLLVERWGGTLLQACHWPTSAPAACLLHPACRPYTTAALPPC